MRLSPCGEQQWKEGAETPRLDGRAGLSPQHTPGHLALSEERLEPRKVVSKKGHSPLHVRESCPVAGQRLGAAGAWRRRGPSGHSPALPRMGGVLQGPAASGDAEG